MPDGTGGLPLDRRGFLRWAAEAGLAGAIAGRLSPSAASAEPVEPNLDFAQLDGINTFIADNYFGSGRPWADVRAFGALGDGVSDDSAAVAAALGALPALGGTVYFPPGKYLLASPVATTRVNVEFSGAGNVGESPGLGDPAATQLVVADGITGLQIGDGSTNVRRGPVFRNLAFRAQGSPAAANTIGLKLLGVSNGRLHNCSFVGFSGPGCIGLWQKGYSGNNPNYLWSYYDCVVADCLVGVRLENCSAHSFFHGYVKGNNTGTTRRPGSIGLHATGSGGGTHRIYATNFQFWERAVFLEVAEGSQLFGGRFEGNDTCLEIAASRCGVWGGTFSNYIIGSNGTAILVAGSATGTMLMPGAITSVSTRILDQGGQTFVLDGAPVDGCSLRLPIVGGIAKLKLGSDVNLYRPGTVDRLKTDNLFQAGGGIATKTVSGPVTDRSFAKAPPDGTIAVDTANKRLYVRIAGRWRSAPLG